MKRTILTILLISQIAFSSFLAYRLYAEVLFALGYIVSATRLIPWEYRYQMFVGNVMMQRGQYEEAVLYYNRTLKWAPYYWDAANNLALTYLQAGRKDTAVLIFKMILEADPDNPDAKWGLRVLLEKD